MSEVNDNHRSDTRSICESAIAKCAARFGYGIRVKLGLGWGYGQVYIRSFTCAIWRLHSRFCKLCKL